MADDLSGASRDRFAPQEDSGVTTYFCSDTHFSHKRIVELSRRPFPSLEAMEDAIVENWNSRVTSGDTVYHLGDFSFGPKDVQAKNVARLNGKITLVRGNHDGSAKRMKSMGFHAVVDEAEYVDELGGHQWYLAHKPWWQMRDGIIGPRRQLCGHVHNDWRRLTQIEGAEVVYDIINVGVDVWDFTPRTFQELSFAAQHRMPLAKAMEIPHHGEM